MEDDKVLRRVVARCRLGDWFLLTMVKRNLDDRQFTSWIGEVEERLCEKEAVRRERERAKRERNGHGWGTKHPGLRERKCFSLEEAEDREETATRAEKEMEPSSGSQSDLASA